MPQRSVSEGRQGRTPRACRQILEYLSANPNAGDTADGILQWWSMEQQLIEARAAVGRALAWLVERDWVVITRAEDARQNYRLNQKMSQEVRQFLQGPNSS